MFEIVLRPGDRACHSCVPSDGPVPVENSQHVGLLFLGIFLPDDVFGLQSIQEGCAAGAIPYFQRGTREEVPELGLPAVFEGATAVAEEAAGFLGIIERATAVTCTVDCPVVNVELIIAVFEETRDGINDLRAVAVVALVVVCVVASLHLRSV